MRFLLLFVLIASIAAVIYSAGLSGGLDGAFSGVKFSLFGDGNEDDSDAPLAEIALPEAMPSPTPELSRSALMKKATAEELSSLGFSTQLMINKEQAERFSRDTPLEFGSSVEYTSLEGITTFGGNNYRNSFAFGIQSVNERRLERAWEKEIGALESTGGDSWTGTGWTGMPIIIRWPDTLMKHIGIFDEFKDRDGFTEVIYPTMDGKIYFFELETGAKTREPIKLRVAMKGTASLDPRGYPILYTGQGMMSDVDGSGAWFRVISLIDNSVLWSFGGNDPFSYREWQAYDSSALIAADADTLVTAGENGVLYSVKLNSTFNEKTGELSLAPSNLEKYRYTADGYGEDEAARTWGIESSVAAWKQYAFFTDNGGYLQCVDLNTLELMYALDIGSDGDGGAVIEESYENDTIYLYASNKLSPGASDSGSDIGKAKHYKLNGLTGEIIWENEYDAYMGDSSSSGGTLSTPHIGHGSIANTVIFNSTLVPVSVDGETKKGGRLIAYDAVSGDEIWRYEQTGGYWSSPVVIYDESGAAYVIQCDRSGWMRMHDAKTGEVIAELDLGSRVESTPAVFGNTIVVGTRGQYGSGETQKVIGVKLS